VVEDIVDETFANLLVVLVAIVAVETEFDGCLDSGLPIKKNEDRGQVGANRWILPASSFIDMYLGLSQQSVETPVVVAAFGNRNSDIVPLHD